MYRCSVTHPNGVPVVRKNYKGNKALSLIEPKKMKNGEWVSSNIFLLGWTMDNHTRTYSKIVKDSNGNTLRTESSKSRPLGSKIYPLTGKSPLHQMRRFFEMVAWDFFVSLQLVNYERVRLIDQVFNTALGLPDIPRFAIATDNDADESDKVLDNEPYKALLDFTISDVPDKHNEVLSNVGAWFSPFLIGQSQDSEEILASVFRRKLSNSMQSVFTCDELAEDEEMSALPCPFVQRGAHQRFVFSWDAQQDAFVPNFLTAVKEDFISISSLTPNDLEEVKYDGYQNRHPCLNHGSSFLAEICRAKRVRKRNPAGFQKDRESKRIALVSGVLKSYPALLAKAFQHPVSLVE